MAASKVPKFGAWEGGENFTVYFDNARKKKNNGQIINPNDPEDYSQMFQQSEGPAQPSQEDPKGQKNKNGRTVNPEPSDAPKPKHNVAVPPVKEGRSKVPQFGGWNGGEEAAYTVYFDNARKNKNAGPALNPVEPHLNDRAQPPNAGGPKYKADQIDNQLRNASRGSNSSQNASRYGKQNPAGQPPLHQKGGKPQQKPPAGRGSQTAERVATVPAFGGWNNPNKQAEGYTGAFTRAKEEKNTPLNPNIPQSYRSNYQSNRQDDTKRRCCFGWF